MTQKSGETDAEVLDRLLRGLPNRPRQHIVQAILDGRLVANGDLLTIRDADGVTECVLADPRSLRERSTPEEDAIRETIYRNLNGAPDAYREMEFVEAEVVEERLKGSSDGGE